MLNLKQGKKLISIARLTIKNYFETKKFELKKFSDKYLEKKMGIFVTIHTFPQKDLRGCIGYILPLQLWEGAQRAAYASAFCDPRFPSLKKEELDKIVIEISILTEPRPIKCKPEDYEKNIKIGEDGLIIRNGPYYGLLLPQVAVHQHWKAKEFLCNLCFKAGLTPDFIHDKNTELWKFQAQIFAEKEPNGEVEEMAWEKKKG